MSTASIMGYRNALELATLGMHCITDSIEPVMCALRELSSDTAALSPEKLTARMGVISELARHGLSVVQDMANTMDCERRGAHEKVNELEGKPL